MKKKFVIGVDFGTDSVRSMILNAMNGAEVATAVSYYPRWKAGLYCHAALNQFRQHPLDYLESLEECITACIKVAGEKIASNIVAISVDTTGSTPVAIDEKGNVEIQYFPTNMMIGDFFTKPLQGKKFEFFRDLILGKKSVSSLESGDRSVLQDENSPGQAQL